MNMHELTYSMKALTISTAKDMAAMTAVRATATERE